MITVILCIQRNQHDERIFCASLSEALSRADNLNPGTQHHIEVQHGDMLHTIDPTRATYRPYSKMPV